MTTRLNKCSEHEITMILDTESDSDKEQKPYDNITSIKVQRNRNSNPRNAIQNLLDTSSDTENVFKNFKCTLPKNSISHKDKVSLRIKLRRSTEQSLYKIDTDSEYEKAICKSRGLGKSRIQRQRKKSYSEVESEGSYTDGKDSSTKNKTNNDNKHEESENDLSRRNRNRKPPLRFSHYYCEIPSLNSPSLRDRKNINYDEDKLFINSIVSNMKTQNKMLKQQRKEASNRSTGRQNVQAEPVSSNVKTNKRNRTPSIKDEENDSSADIKISKKKSLKKSNKSESGNSKLDDVSKVYETTKKQDSLISVSISSTPVKSRQKRLICGNIPKQMDSVNNNDNSNEGECLTDSYKRIKISSAIKTDSANSTPIKTNKQKGEIFKETSTNVQSYSKNNNDAQDEYLSDMYKCIQISSAKKNILTPQTRNNMQKSIELGLENTHLSTPKSRPKYNNLTPSLVKRNSALIKPTTPLQEARSKLHVSIVPKSLPCREEEFNNIFTFLRGKLEDKSGGCIYISGVPGTGKTATVNEAVRCLQKLILKGQLDDFNYIAINGMKLTEPRQAYVQILKQLDGKTATWEQAYHTLDKRFRSGTSKMTLLLVDELDLLCTKRQDVVYNLLDWPTKSTAQLVVITIANTMDLPERVFMGRVTSRLGLTRLTFQPYNYKQLQEIVVSRLKDFDGFRSEAIQLVARKVSAVSGDARRALDICRRAMEITELRNGETISLQDVSEAISEMIASAKVQAIKHCSEMEKIFLQAVSAEVTRTSIEEVYFKDAYKQVESLCSFDGIEIPTITEILAVCGRLGSNRLLICEHSRSDLYQKILLNVSTDDIHYATRELNLN
ncbi:origin recognition complex subunit 1 isoform X2 [Frieseomelitta varia]|uniref:origin recognition complex subunit 1 isoform X2 n=1 Tax=Frieseomelitta varia TaxID=561572 RepID=UPI001CB69A0D|nr:origin recognition complex subunit 1 isoform X2 [Frieseomelitta varia]